MPSYAGPVSDHFDGKRFFDSDGFREDLCSTCCAGRSTASRRPGLSRRRAPMPTSRRRGSKAIGSGSFLRRPCQLADPDRRPQHPGRPGVVGARFAGQLRRSATAQRPRHCVRGAAADRCRAGVARPLRSSRSGDAVAARRKFLAARGDAARQRSDDDIERCRDPRRGLRLARPRGAERACRGDAGADAALEGARPVRPQQGAVGELRAADAGRQRSTSSAIPAMARAGISAASARRMRR